MAMTFEALRHILKKRATILYPFKEREKVHVPKGFRGELVFYLDKCIGCASCFKVCPSETIEIIYDGQKRRPIFYLDRCTRCQQCEEICPTHAIELTDNFETVGFDRKEKIVK
jgi:formate hydrogenlyase subunit 6/NADH:ubiquinone oxidoreductase subunit I